MNQEAGKISTHSSWIHSCWISVKQFAAVLYKCRECEKGIWEIHFMHICAIHNLTELHIHIKANKQTLCYQISLLVQPWYRCWKQAIYCTCTTIIQACSFEGKLALEKLWFGGEWWDGGCLNSLLSIVWFKNHSPSMLSFHATMSQIWHNSWNPVAECTVYHVKLTMPLAKPFLVIDWSWQNQTGPNRKGFSH